MPRANRHWRHRRLRRLERQPRRAHLERDFAAYLRDEHAKDPPNARTSAWKTYQLLLGTVGARAAREMVKYLFEEPRNPRARIEEPQE